MHQIVASTGVGAKKDPPYTYHARCSTTSVRANQHAPQPADMTAWDSEVTCAGCLTGRIYTGALRG